MTALSAAALRTGPLTGAGARAVRLTAFAALAVFAAAHWATIVHPAAPGAMTAMLAVAIAAGVCCDATGAVRSRPGRAAALAVVLLAALAVVLLAGGAPASLLRPDRWPRLASEAATAIGALPAVRTPYLGGDPWIRTTLLAGGGVLLVAAAVLALRLRAHSFAAATCLGVLYTVPVVQHAPHRPWLDGAAFAVLLGVCLWGDRLRRRELPLALGLGGVVVLGAALAAPRLDSGSPWIDYESLTNALEGGATVTFRWDQDYRSLGWPRTGLVLARVRERGDLYLKAVDLDRFDGHVWRAPPPQRDSADAEPPVDRAHPQWRQTIHVRVEGLRTPQFLGAGTTSMIRRSTEAVHETAPGIFAVDAHPLRRGDSYDAAVYWPQPTVAALHAAGDAYPAAIRRELVVGLPGTPATGAIDVAFPPWGQEAAVTATGRHGLVTDPLGAVQRSPYRRELALAMRLRATASDPYDLVRRVIARVRKGATYTEAPPAPGGLAPLDAFLFRDHAGYCQHFAGATALLLRMAGVPARVVAGFSPGTRGRHGERVIRDFDAHNWVEVYFPRIGWVTFDPTPGDAPARGQLTDRDASAVAPAAPASSVPRAHPPIPGQPRTRDEVPRMHRTPGDAAAAAPGVRAGGGGFPAPAALGAALVLLAGAGLAASARRRRRVAGSDDPQLAELVLALERTGRARSPDLTLHGLERLLAGSTEARDYVRALRLARYGPAGRPVAPTPAQRQALRRELAAGLGLRGRLRAAWALPPRPRELLRRRRRPPYTA